MPLYDYECRNCGHVVEVLHGINDPGPTACERCGGTMRKLLSAPAIVFKGSGWAKKDFRDSRSAAKAGAGASKQESGDASSSAGGAAKSDSAKPDSAKSDSAKSDSAPGRKSTDGPAKQTPGKDSAAAKTAD